MTPLSQHIAFTFFMSVFTSTISAKKIKNYRKKAATTVHMVEHAGSFPAQRGARLQLMGQCNTSVSQALPPTLLATCQWMDSLTKLCFGLV